MSFRRLLPTRAQSTDAKTFLPTSPSPRPVLLANAKRLPDSNSHNDTSVLQTIPIPSTRTHAHRPPTTGAPTHSILLFFPFGTAGLRSPPSRFHTRPLRDLAPLQPRRHSPSDSGSSSSPWVFRDRPLGVIHRLCHLVPPLSASQNTYTRPSARPLAARCLHSAVRLYHKIHAAGASGDSWTRAFAPLTLSRKNILARRSGGDTRSSRFLCLALSFLGFLSLFSFAVVGVLGVYTQFRGKELGTASRSLLLDRSLVASYRMLLSRLPCAGLSVTTV